MKLLFIATAILFFTSCNNDSDVKVTIDSSSVTKPDTIPVTAPATNNPHTGNNAMPVTVLTYIIDSLTGWMPARDSAWDPYWYNQYKKDSSLVNYLPVDVNCDGAMDYAMILSGPSNVTGAWVFISRGNGFLSKKLEEMENPSGKIGIGLARFDKGTHTGIDLDAKNPKPVNVPCDGVTIDFFEKAAHSFYWQNGQFKFMQTGD